MISYCDHHVYIIMCLCDYSLYSLYDSRTTCPTGEYSLISYGTVTIWIGSSINSFGKNWPYQYQYWLEFLNISWYWYQYESMGRIGIGKEYPFNTIWHSSWNIRHNFDTSDTLAIVNNKNLAFLTFLFSKYQQIVSYRNWKHFILDHCWGCLNLSTPQTFQSQVLSFKWDIRGPCFNPRLWIF